MLEPALPDDVAPGSEVRPHASPSGDALLHLEHELALRLGALTDLREALVAILDAAVQVRDVDSGGIYLVEPETGALALAAHRGLGEAFIAEVARIPRDDPRNAVARSGTPIFASYLDVDRAASPAQVAEGLRAIGVIPVQHEGRTIAALNVASHAAADLSAPARAALVSIASHIGGALSRVRASEATRASEQSFQALFDSLQDLLFVLDERARIVHANPVALARLGYTADELYGRPVTDLHLPEEREAAQRVVAEILAGRLSTCPLSLRTRGGALIPVETVVSRGRFRGQDAIFGVSRDISARVEAEGALRALNAELERRVAERTAELSDLHDNAPCGYCTLDPRGNVLRVNATALRWLGYPREEVLGRNVGAFLSPESLRAHHESLAAARADPSRERWEGQEWERELVRKDGSSFWVLVTATHVTDAAGRLVERRTALVDITERKRATQILREQDARVRDALEHARDLVALTDAEHRITYANPAFCAALGYAEREPLGRSLLEVIPEERREQIEELLSGALAAPVPVRGELAGRDGRRIPVEGTMSARVEGGRFAGVRSYFTDVTERLAAETALQKSNAVLAAANDALLMAGRAKDEFLASMSHELRTPLNGILGITEALQEGVYGAPGERQRAALGRVEESGRHLLALISDILDLAKVEAGKMELSPSRVHVGQLVADSVRLVEESARRKGLRLSVSQEGCLAPVLLDERRMKQVLVNLLSNAVKFTPRGGSILIVAEEDGEGEALHLRVRDSGMGIAVGDASRVFDRFVQLDGRLSRQHAGTGLGLALVRRIVDLHGGGIELESEVGRGSCFTVSVPLRPASPPSARPSARPEGRSSPPLRGRALVVASEEGAPAIGEALRAAGLVVETATDAQAALAQVEAAPPELLVLPAREEAGDPLAVVRALRSAPRAEVAEVPVVALAALALPGDRERWRAAGVEAFVVRPVSGRRWAGIAAAARSRAG